MPEEKGRRFLPEDFLENDTRLLTARGYFCTWKQTSQYTFLEQLLASILPNFICALLPQHEHLRQNIWRNALFRAAWDVNKKNHHPIMLSLLSPLVHMTEEFQYAQVNSNGQADNLLCNHSSKVLLVDRELHICKVSALRGQLVEEQIPLLSS